MKQKDLPIEHYFSAASDLEKEEKYIEAISCYKAVISITVNREELSQAYFKLGDMHRLLSEKLRFDMSYIKEKVDKPKLPLSDDLLLRKHFITSCIEESLDSYQSALEQCRYVIYDVLDMSKSGIEIDKKKIYQFTLKMIEIDKHMMKLRPDSESSIIDWKSFVSEHIASVEEYITLSKQQYSECLDQLDSQKKELMDQFNSNFKLEPESVAIIGNNSSDTSTGTEN